MSDEIVEEAMASTSAVDRPNPHLLAYDFFKHMTSLSILTLGGVLTLSASIFGEELDRERIFLSIALIAASGFLAFAAQLEMVDWANRGTGRPRWIARWGRGLVAAAYGCGVGAFLSIAHEAIG